MFICKIWFTKHVAYRKIFGIILQKKIFHIDDSDYIVRRILVDRNTRKHILAKYVEYFLIGCVHLNKCHINTWNHDLFGLGIAKIEQIMNHITFFIFDDTSLLTDIYNGAKLFLGHLCICIVWIDAKQKQKT